MAYIKKAAKKQRAESNGSFDLSQFDFSKPTLPGRASTAEYSLRLRCYPKAGGGESAMTFIATPGGVLLRSSPVIKTIAVGSGQYKKERACIAVLNSQYFKAESFEITADRIANPKAFIFKVASCYGYTEADLRTGFFALFNFEPIEGAKEETFLMKVVSMECKKATTTK